MRSLDTMRRLRNEISSSVSADKGNLRNNFPVGKRIRKFFPPTDSPHLRKDDDARHE